MENHRLQEDKTGRVGHLPKVPIALLLGLVGFMLTWVTGSSGGWRAVCITQAAWCFVCQFLLSWGNVNAYRTDWASMLALNAPVLLLVLGGIVAGALQVLAKTSGWNGLGESALLLLTICGGTYAGAGLASVLARLSVAQD